MELTEYLTELSANEMNDFSAGISSQIRGYIAVRFANRPDGHFFDSICLAWRPPL